MPVGEVFVGEESVGDLFSGKCQSGNCPVGELSGYRYQVRYNLALFCKLLALVLG